MLWRSDYSSREAINDLSVEEAEMRLRPDGLKGALDLASLQEKDLRDRLHEIDAGPGAERRAKNVQG